MTKKEQELINVFMGYEKQTYPLLEHLNNRDYSHNWSELMPVIEKISRYKYEDGETAFPRTFGMLDKETGDSMFRFNRMCLHIDSTLIGAAYNACLEFIESLTPESIGS